VTTQTILCLLCRFHFFTWAFSNWYRQFLESLRTPFICMDAIFSSFIWYPIYSTTKKNYWSRLPTLHSRFFGCLCLDELAKLPIHLVVWCAIDESFTRWMSKCWAILDMQIGMAKGTLILNYTNYEVEGDTYILRMRGCDPSSIQVLRIVPNTVRYPKLRTNMLRYSNIFSAQILWCLWEPSGNCSGHFKY
jgi:hypothetical protein